MNLKSIKVGVLGGGVSSEREISLISAGEAFKSLQRQNINAVLIDITTTNEDALKKIIQAHKIDLAFIALHGEFGEDGKIQAMLERFNIIYSGSRSVASYNAMDKIVAKQMFVKSGIPTAGFSICQDVNKIPQGIKYPVVVKPYFAGSSIGVSVVINEASLHKGLAEAFKCQNKVLIEDYIDGREVTVGILDDKALELVEIVPKKGFYDFTAKYSDGMTDFVAPADIEKNIYRKIQEIALAAHTCLGCRHFSRVDIRLDRNNCPYVLEVNSIPGLTTHSLLPLSAKCHGINFDQLIFKMVELGINEKI